MNAVIYARYSCSAQTEQSIEGQLHDCYAYAEREGYSIVGEYIDRAITGRSDDRPEFQRMIKDSAKKQFDYVLVYKLDRFARNRYDSAIYKHKLKENGVKVLSVMENIGDNPESIILEAMLEASAEYYSRDLSQKVRRGQRESALKGLYIGGLPPIGYKVIDHKVYIDEEKAPIIRYAFEQYANGIPKRQIIDELTARGIRNGRGKPLTLSSFQVALRNRKYIGEYSFRGIEMNNFPPLIDKELFEKVQKRLDAVKHAPAASKAKIEYLLQGKGFCGYCGARLVGECGRGKCGGIYYYYACGEKKKLHTCKKRNERKDFLEWYVVEQTVECVLTPERMDMIAGRIVEEYEKEFNGGKVKALQRRIEKVDRELDKLADAMIEAGSKSLRARIDEKARALEAQKDDLSIDLSKLKIASGIRYTKRDILAWLKQFCNGDLMDENFRRRIIDTFVTAVYLFDDKLIVYYNIRDGKQVSYIDMCESLEDAGIDVISEDCGGVRISDAKARSKPA